jgi:hypothetical protein
LAQSYANPRTRYLIIDIGVATGCSTRASIYGTSLNDCGDVVGYTNDSHIDGCRVSPWIWSYCGRFDLPPQTAVLLNDLVSSMEDGRALSINNDGDVVGDLGSGDPSYIQNPYVWRFDAMGLDSSFAIGGGTVEGFAHAVSESDAARSAVVVGATLAPAFPGVAGRGFSYDLDGSPPLLATLDPLTGVFAGSASAAWGVALATDPFLPTRACGASAASPEEAGLESGGLGQSGGGGVPVIECAEDGSVNPVRWNLTGSPAAPTAVREDFLPNGPLDLDPWNARLYAIDGSGEAVGVYADATIDCKSRAAIWSPSGVCTSLGVLPPLTTLSESQALSIAPADPVGGTTIVVGQDIATNTGLVWWRGSPPVAPGSGSFELTLANQLQTSNCLWEIIRVTDVNAKGWLLAVANALGEANEQRTLLLLPYDCPGDLTMDGIVEAADLAVLLGQWGQDCVTTYSCECIADLDGVAPVGANDLAILLGAWGTACSTNYCEGCELPLPEGGTPESLAGVQEQASAAGGVDLSVILAIAGQPDTAAFGNWLASLTPEQMAQFAAVVEALSSSGGDQ